jgi:hypothetical protein
VVRSADEHLFAEQIPANGRAALRLSAVLRANDV